MLFPAISSAAVKYVGPGEYYNSIKWAYNESEEGDTIIVKPGTYAENIIIDKSIVLISEKLHGAVIGSGQDSKGNLRINQGTVIVDGFLFNENDQTQGIVVGSLDVNLNPVDCVIRNNEIIKRKNGVNVSPAARSTNLINNRIIDCEAGISFSGQGKCTISGNYIENCLYDGIFLVGSDEEEIILEGDTVIGALGNGIMIDRSYVSLGGNVFMNNAQNGINTSAGKNNIQILKGNKISGNSLNGITVESGSTLTIKESEVNDNTNHGIVIQNGSSATLSGNLIQRNGFSGVMCYGSVKLSGNILSENVPCGIESYGEAEIEGNTINENADLGIFIQPGATGVVIKDNTINHNGGSGLMMGSEGIVTGNTLDGNRTGIHASANEGLVTISGGNQILNQVEHGIMISPECHALISDNEISYNGTGVVEEEDFSGIFISGSATILNNTINYNGSSGVLVAPEAREVVIRDNPEVRGNREGIFLFSPAHVENNMILENKEQGIWVGEDADSSFIKGNLVSGNRTGIVIRENADCVSVLNCQINNNERGIVSSGICTLRRNTIEFNTAYGIRIARKGINLGNIEADDGGYNLFGGNTAWNIINLTPDTIFACYNFWGTQDTLLIDSTLNDDDEDALMGPVIFLPLVTQDPTGIQRRSFENMENGKLVLFDVYPNPFSNELYIRFATDSRESVDIRIYSADGKIIALLGNEREFAPGEHLITWNDFSVEVGDLENGTYIIFMSVKGKKYSRIIHLIR